mgnify:CR=1 FL=1
MKFLISNNIFGIDEKNEAIEVAKFSLSLAICEILAPEIIWNELHFDDLSKNGNLIANDFFDIIANIDNYHDIKDFDLVIGNPPFIANLTTEASRLIENKSLNKNTLRPKLPNNQLAYLFLEQSFKLIKEDAYISMIQPSGFLYNNQAEDFRKYLLFNFNLRQVIDFSGLSKLYDGSKKDKNGKKVSIVVPTSVVCFKKNKPNINDSEVLHLTVRESFESKEKIYFNLSYYDFHWISYKEALENKYIWKCNLVGGSRVVDIVNKFNQYAKFKDYVKEKERSNNWIYSSGFFIGNKKIYADYLYNTEALQTSQGNALNENGIDWNKTYIINEKNFEAPRNPDLYKTPLIFRKTINKNTKSDRRIT